MSRVAALLGQVNLAVGSDAVRLLAIVTLVGFAATAALPPAYHISTICGRIALTDVPTLFSTMMVVPSLWPIFLGWTAMTLAMMPLLVVGPVAHVRRSSLPRRKLRATLLFGIGYGLCWTVAGASLAPIALMLALVLGPSVASVLTLVVALVWSASPMAQIARNACHRTLRIGALGSAADKDRLAKGSRPERHASRYAGPGCCYRCWLAILI